ncbi:hypothetical protein NN561_005521 [Cricetulus griseus]
MASAGGGQEAEGGNREEPGLQRHGLLTDCAALRGIRPRAAQPRATAAPQPALTTQPRRSPSARTPRSQALGWGVSLRRSPRLRNCDKLEFPEPERVKPRASDLLL